MRLRTLVICWFATVAGLEAKGACDHDDSTFRCVKFTRNYDGDTITVDIPNVHSLIGKNISVRLLGIDTPEVKTQDKCEKQAARTTKKLVNRLLSDAKQIDLERIGRDKYFRILADVRVDGKSLSQILIKNKLAVAYDGGTKQKVDWCAFADLSSNDEPN